MEPHGGLRLGEVFPRPSEGREGCGWLELRDEPLQLTSVLSSHFLFVGDSTFVVVHAVT